MEAKQKLHFQLLTEGNAQSSHPTEDTLCARFNTSFTKEDSPTNAFRLPQSSQAFLSQEDDELLVLRKNNENMKSRLKRLSTTLYQKGVIQNQRLVNTISKEMKPGSNKSPQNNDLKTIKNTKLDEKKGSVVSITQIPNKENKKMEFSPRNVSPRDNGNKPSQEKLIQTGKKEVQIKPKISTNLKTPEGAVKSPIRRHSRIPSNPVINKKVDKKLSPGPVADSKVSKHARKGSMPSDLPTMVEKSKKKTQQKEQKTPNLSPKLIPKSARGNRDQKEVGSGSSFVIQETGDRSSKKKEEDVLVQINIKCYSPSRQGPNGEKSPKSEKDLIRALKMVRKFIDKSIEDDSKLKKLTALLTKSPQQIS